MEATLRRLYVGGLGPSVTDDELSERFGRFGKVGEVDIIYRKDDQGNPVRTFAYMNINISDTDLKKCLSLLNKTKWKGGLLQIEMAKESFLHKLEQERQAAKEKKKPKEQSRPQNDLLKSLEKAGVTDFQMKAAVPGTEVPNHKNWVVSKYGRVLPVLHLKGNKEMNITKYDPSKYCHNVKKLDNISLVSTPVTQLTWHLDGGNDAISKKRRGEFPEFKSPIKKNRVNSCNKTEEKESNSRTPQATLQKAADAVESQPKGKKSRGYVGNKSINSMSDDEYDSEEELKTIIEREKMVVVGEGHAEDADIEVVDNSFTPRYKTHWAEEIGNRRRSHSHSEDDHEYDSADTDEIITVARTSQNCRKGKSEKSQKSNVVSTEFSNSKYHVNQENGRTEEDDQSNDAEDSSGSCSDEEYKSMMQNCYRLDLTIEDLEALANQADESDGDEVNDQNASDQEYDSADTDTVIAGAKCVQRGIVGEQKGSDGRETTRDKSKDLGAGDCNIKLSSGSRISYLESKSVKQDPSVRTLNSSPGKKGSKSTANEEETSDVTREGEEAETRTLKSTKNKSGNGNVKRKKGNEPEDIVASILEEDDSSNDDSKRKKKKNPLPRPPAFKGLGSLMSSLSVSVSCTKSYDHPEAVGCETNGNATFTEGKGHQESENKGERQPKTDQNASTDAHWTSEGRSNSSSSSSSDESSSEKEASSASSPVTKPKVSQKSSSEGQPNARTKRLQDNQKRLAAMEVRRKEREQQKQVIQGALIKLDSQTAKKSQHIVFDSESEEESEKQDASASNGHTKKMIKPIKAKLFDSSGEDSDDEEEKDDERFEIKTQYEGRSGEKLMVLQSRFGTDERFKMDARFLEDSSEEEADTEKPQTSQADDDGLSAEKKKNLDILQSVLNINVEPQPTSKKAAKAKTFKDLNALQYDPTKEDHAVFERKSEEEKKESKAARKKKRLEAEKLPEVSKEIFHEVILDFKEVFGAPKPQATEEPETTWDKVEEPQKMEVETSMSNMELGLQKTEEPAGFTFSFFGTSAEETVSPYEPYKIETIKAAKVAWQEDPRFQDSSSEGEEEAEEDTTDTATNTSSHLERSSSIRFFFFVKDDTRLKEGPKMFIRSSKSEQKAKDWDHMRDSIMEQCRKRHKDAKKRLKTKQ
ncbi:nucleolar protein 8 [Ranitomeya variabilis]|uniref:nucleolar protein 8 n=1 Tax=Ranitomeya variabilis TaxID=490064 RepID=UPI004056C759